MTKRITEPRKRTRTVQIKFWATPEEKELIEKKMALTGIVHLGAYLRKMAIDGYAVNLQIPELKDILRYQRYANNNINQIAKKVNATGSIYAEDVEEIRQRVDAIYDQIDKLITKIAKIKSAPERCAAAEFFCVQGGLGILPNKQFWCGGYHRALLASSFLTTIF